MALQDIPNPGNPLMFKWLNNPYLNNLQYDKHPTHINYTKLEILLENFENHEIPLENRHELAKLVFFNILTKDMVVQLQIYAVANLETFM